MQPCEVRKGDIWYFKKRIQYEEQHEEGIATGMVLKCEVIGRNRVGESLGRGIRYCAKECFLSPHV